MRRLIRVIIRLAPVVYPVIRKWIEKRKSKKYK